MARVFATKVWGLGGETWGALGFSKEGVRNNLAGLFKPDDFVLYLGNFSEPTKPEEQGRLLGLVKISPTHVDTENLVEPSIWRGHLDNNGGKPKWPFGLPLIEVWRFTSDPLPKERDLLPRFAEEGLAMKLATNFEELSDLETRSVLNLPRKRIENIYASPAIKAAQDRESIRAGLQGACKGPSPILGKREILLSVKEFCTYCMELMTTEASFQAFGVRLEVNDKRRLYKIGWAVNATSRQRALNFGFPNPKILGWRPILVQKRKSQLDAYNLEQAILSALESKKIAGRTEMVFCTEDEVQRIFRKAIVSSVPSVTSDDEKFVLQEKLVTESQE